MTEINFAIGQRHYSFNILENLLTTLMNECLGS
jgi:hypothetical protein